MLFFKNKVAVPNVRKLNRKIKKINKIRTHYLDFCNIMIDDVNNFTEVMMKTHDEMIDAIKTSMEVEKNFDRVYTKYSNSDDSNELDFDGLDIEEYDDDDDEEDDEDDEDEEDDEDDEDVEDVTDVESNETTESVADNNDACCCKDDECDCECDKHSECDCHEEHEFSPSMRNFKGDAASAIFITVNSLYCDDDFSEFEKAYSSLGFTKTEIDETIDAFTKKNMAISITHIAGETPDDTDMVKLVEVTTPLLMIPHSDPCRKVLNDILNNSSLKISSGSKPIVTSNDSNISTWYFCDAGIFEDDDRVIFVNVDISKIHKTVTLRFISSSACSNDEIKDMLK